MQSIATEEPKQRLDALKEYIPGHPEVVYDFGRFLKEYLGDDPIDPLGFISVCEFAIIDIEAGVNSLTGEPIKNKLIGCPSNVFSAIEAYIPEIAKAIFPDEFAEEVKKVLQEI